MATTALMPPPHHNASGGQAGRLATWLPPCTPGGILHEQPSKVGGLPPFRSPEPCPAHLLLSLHRGAGGLSGGVTEDQLRALFAPYGDIVYVKIPPGKGCGFVQYVQRSAAEQAMQVMQVGQGLHSDDPLQTQGDCSGLWELPAGDCLRSGGFQSSKGGCSACGLCWWAGAMCGIWVYF